MKLPNRHVSIFTLSALDVLAMATGVFVLLLVMLMPYYRKTFDAGAEIEAVRVAAAETVAEVESIEASARRYRGEADAAAAEAAQLAARAAALEAEAATLRSRPVPEPAEETGRDERQRVIEALDLIFVIDTTASMGPAIRALALSIRSIVRILERLVPSVQIGVAAYKDRDIPLPPVIVFPLTPTDPYLARIVAFLDGLEASPIGSRTIEEDMHLGLESAMLMRLRPNARQALIVIGDAAAHRPLQAETVARVGHFVEDHEHRTVSALFVTTPSALSHGLAARPFFRELAMAGQGSFNDHTGSMIESVLLSVLVDVPPRRPASTSRDP
jgi:cell division protein FtsB